MGNWGELGEAEIADMMATGREFAIGPRVFRVKEVGRGHISEVGEAYVVGPVQRGDGYFELGLYNAPPDGQGIPREGTPLVCVLVLEFVRLEGSQAGDTLKLPI